jgi:glycosyltransferase involved in cell wall biosynthesis
VLGDTTPSDQRLSTSICLATFNGAPFLKAQLESLAAQHRLADELVVVDDASRDSTLEILEALAPRAPFPVHVHRSEVNRGVNATFEAAYARASSDVILPCDQDDVWHPDKMEALVSVLERVRNAVAAFCNSRIVDAAGRPLGEDLWSRLRVSKMEIAALGSGNGTGVWERRALVSAHQLAFRSSLLPMLLPLPARLSHDEWIALVLSGEGRIVAVPECLVDYRIHGANAIGSWLVPRQDLAAPDRRRRFAARAEALSEASEDDRSRFGPTGARPR